MVGFRVDWGETSLACLAQSMPRVCVSSSALLPASLSRFPQEHALRSVAILTKRARPIRITSLYQMLSPFIEMGTVIAK
ncbi:hypothetical protein CCR95_24190 [Thiocystis minor]|nr:hypothetical protein [Thiocystis minor]